MRDKSKTQHGRAAGRSRIVRAVKLAVSCLREIFDESAYARFLHRVGGESSPAKYAAFRREYEAVKAQRPRCC